MFCRTVLGYAIAEEPELLRQQERRVYETLNTFVDWLLARGLRPSTLAGCASVVRCPS